MAFFCFCALPVVRLRMAIGEGKSTPSIMINSGGVDPQRVFHAKGEGRVIQIIDVFINQNPKHRRAGRLDF